MDNPYDNYVFPMDEVLSDIEHEIINDNKYKADILLAYIQAIYITNLGVLENLTERIRGMYTWGDEYTNLTKKYDDYIRKLLDSLYAEIDANPSLLLDSLLLRKKTK